MKRKFTVVSLLMALFLVSACAPQVSDEELEAKLDTLSDEDLDAVIDESSKSKALAGQAIAIERKYLPSLTGTVSKDRLLQTAQAVKIKRLEEKEKVASVVQPSGTTPPSASGIIIYGQPQEYGNPNE